MKPQPQPHISRSRAAAKTEGRSHSQRPQVGVGTLGRLGVGATVPKRRSDDISVLLSRAKKCRNSPYSKIGT